MSSRAARESGGGVLSFTFLDVLTCTMGSLVLLVVIIGQKAAHTRLEDALRNGPRRPTAAAAVEAPADQDASALAAQLAKTQEDESKLAALRAEAEERLRQERSRVSHLEDHERRLEHELAKLQITLERLQAAEGEQTVDQESAENELGKLKQLVKDTEQQLDELREGAGGKKSFAIVPYKGTNGTYRRPIYIECTKDAVTIQPEGIQLTAVDFDGPIRSGNPLAAAVRAAREELNARTAAAGQTDLPDPYPLLIVRPDGARAYSAALSAISAWDADYGYEFVDADWDLEFPAADPRLGQAMVHAVEQARARQAMLAKVAPRRYGSRLSARTTRGGVGGGGTGGSGDADGFDVIAQGGGDRIGQQGVDGDLATLGGGDGGGVGTSHPAGSSGTTAGAMAGGGAGGADAAGELAAGSSGGNFADQCAATEQAGARRGGGDSSTGGSGDAGSGGDGGLAAADAQADGAGAASGAGGATGSAGGQGGVAGGTASTGSTVAGSSAAASMAGTGAGGQNSSGSSAVAGGSNTSGGGQAGGAIAVNAIGNNQNAPASAAETRGANWANAAASRRATPITRPIQAVVRPQQLDVLPTHESAGATTEAPTIVSFQQPTNKVLDDLAAVLQQHIRDWGAAGQDMYWRPTLMLQVAPGADQHAARLNELLRDSGVDVRLQRIAARPTGEAADARR